MIHSVRKKGLKAHSTNYVQQGARGELLLQCTVHKACNLFFIESWLHRQNGGAGQTLISMETCQQQWLFALWHPLETANQRSSPQVDFLRRLSSVPSPGQAVTEEEIIQIYDQEKAQRHLECLCECVPSLRGHAHNTVSGSSEAFPNETQSRSLRRGIIPLLGTNRSCIRCPVRPSVDSFTPTSENRKDD